MRSTTEKCLRRCAPSITFVRDWDVCATLCISFSLLALDAKRVHLAHDSWWISSGFYGLRTEPHNQLSIKFLLALIKFNAFELLLIALCKNADAHRRMRNKFLGLSHPALIVASKIDEEHFVPDELVRETRMTITKKRRLRTKCVGSELLCIVNYICHVAARSPALRANCCIFPFFLTR